MQHTQFRITPGSILIVIQSFASTSAQFHLISNQGKTLTETNVRELANFQFLAVKSDLLSKVRNLPEDAIERLYINQFVSTYLTLQQGLQEVVKQ
jgi:hypothetical protein